MKIVSAEFIKSSFRKEDWPRKHLPEVAFAGRSNVGKSSLLNAILRRKNLVKTSATPGKTRAINFFEINKAFYFTDLPGYGFAVGDKREIKKWRPMIEEYLSGREILRGLVHIVDIRRKPDELEIMLVDWVHQNDIPHILVANKCDKLSNNKCAVSVREIEKRLGTRPIIFSAFTGKGKKELWESLRKLLEAKE